MLAHCSLLRTECGAAGSAAVGAGGELPYLGRDRSKLWLEVTATGLRRRRQGSAARPLPGRAQSRSRQRQRSAADHRPSGSCSSMFSSLSGTVGAVR